MRRDENARRGARSAASRNHLRSRAIGLFEVDLPGSRTPISWLQARRLPVGRAAHVVDSARREFRAKWQARGSHPTHQAYEAQWSAGSPAMCRTRVGVIAVRDHKPRAGGHELWRTRTPRQNHPRLFCDNRGTGGHEEHNSKCFHKVGSARLTGKKADSSGERLTSTNQTCDRESDGLTKGRVELPRREGHGVLSAACLPVTPLGHERGKVKVAR